MTGLTVIIINYRSIQDILNCLKSAYQFSSAKNFEWIIVNNDPESDDESLVVEQFPDVKWIDAGYNAGFARANNMGIRESAGDTVLLLNPDTIILDDAIGRCYEELCSTEFVAGAVQLKNPDGTPQITGNYFMKGGLNHLLPLPYLGPFLRWVAFRFKAKRTNVLSASSEQIVDWITGAFLMVKKSAIEKAGLMDEDFFLYSEETEWCNRLGKFGQLCVFGDLSAIHLQGESVNRVTGKAEKGYGEITGKRGLQLLVSQQLRIRKQFGVTWFLVHQLLHTLEVPLFLVSSLIENTLRFRNPVRNLQDVASYAENVIKLWKLTPKIWRNEPHFYKMM